MEININYESYISLNSEDFRCLVRGGKLKINCGLTLTVNIALEDIRYDEINNAILDAVKGIGFLKWHQKNQDNHVRVMSLIID